MQICYNDMYAQYVLVLKITNSCIYFIESNCAASQVNNGSVDIFGYLYSNWIKIHSGYVSIQ
jgi:hypothetical protein